MDYDTVIELDEVTLEDCIDLYEKKNMSRMILAFLLFTFLQ